MQYLVPGLPSGWAAQGNVSLSGGQVHITNPNYGAWDNKLQVNVSVSGQASYRRWGLSIQNNAISREECIGTAVCTYASLMSLTPGVWYRGQLVIDSSQRFYARAWRVDNPAGIAESWAVHSDWAGMEWKFKNFVLGGTQDLDEYQQSLLYGKGQRTKMSDGPGTTQWSYDQRGQMIAERKVVGSEVFYTFWGYNTAGLQSWIRYPGDNAGLPGEQVFYTYHPQMLVDSVKGANTYVRSTSYDAAGRVDIRLLSDRGGNAILRSDYDYFAWSSQGGRLLYLKTGTPGNPTSLQSFEYDYDPVGNINWIKDYLH